MNDSPSTDTDTARSADDADQPASTPAYNSRHWSGKSRGGASGNLLFLKIVKRLGTKAAYVLLVPVAFYYLIASPKSVKSSYRYLRKILGPQPKWKWPFLIYGNFFSLGMSLLDRFAMMMGRQGFSCSREGEHHILDAIEQGNGVILIGAHVGNWAAGGYFLSHITTRVNLVVLENEVERVQRVFDREFPDRGLNVLSSSEDLSSSIAIMKALRNGEIVIFNGDRALDGTPSAEASFLGAPADFPAGPYLMAGVTGAPVIQVFAMRDGVDRYSFFCFPAQSIGKEYRTHREETLQACAAEYAGRLESVLRKYPFQWYNFYPFWKNER